MRSSGFKVYKSLNPLSIYRNILLLQQRQLEFVLMTADKKRTSKTPTQLWEKNFCEMKRKLIAFAEWVGSKILITFVILERFSISNAHDKNWCFSDEISNVQSHRQSPQRNLQFFRTKSLAILHFLWPPWCLTSATSAPTIFFSLPLSRLNSSSNPLDN